MGGVYLFEQFMYVLCVGVGGGLVGYGIYLFDQVGVEQFVQGYQYQVDGVVVVDVVVGVGVQSLVDDFVVDWVEDDYCVVFYVQVGGGIDLVVLLVGFVQFGEYFVGVVVVLVGQDYVEGFQFVDVVGVFQWSDVFVYFWVLVIDV